MKDVYLESVWVAGAESFAELATVMGEARLAADAQARAAKARSATSTKLWNPRRDFFFYGFNGRGELLTQELGQPNWGIWMGSFDSDKCERALDRMARAEWESDWGLRSIPSNDPLYIADSYGHGSVWPLGSGVQALAFYTHHRPLQGYPLWRALVEQTFLNSLGHATEVFSGELYRELDVSVPEQIWSSGMVITALVRGLLGIDPDAKHSRLRFAPHLPPGWPAVSLTGLELDASTLNLRVEQSPTQIKLLVENSGPSVEVEFAPEIPLGSGNAKATLNSRSVAVTAQDFTQDRHATVKFNAGAESEVTISFTGGVRPALPTQPIRIGDESHGLRVLSSKLDGHTYRAQVEGRRGACSEFLLSTPWQVKQVTGGRATLHRDDEWRFRLSPDSHECDGGNAGPYQVWRFQVEFEP